MGAGWLLGFSQRTTGVPLDELELELEDELLDEELDDELEDDELDDEEELELDEDDELLELLGSPPQPINARVTAAVNTFKAR